MACTPPKRARQPLDREQAHRRRSAAGRARLGTSPRGRKIIITIRIGAEHDVLVVVEHGEELRQGGQQHGADDGAAGRGHAAQHHHGHELDRAQEAGLVGRQQAREVGEQRAGEARQHRRDHEHQHLVARATSTPATPAAISEPCSARKRPADRAVDQVERQSHDRSRSAATSVSRPGSRATPPAEQTDSAATDMPSGPPVSATSLVQHDRDDDAEAEGRHGEIVAAQTQDRPGDGEGQQRR